MEAKVEPGSEGREWKEVFPAGLRVLVVDDDPLCLRVVSMMLQRCNYTGEAVRARSGLG